TLASRPPPRERDDLARPRYRDLVHGGFQPPRKECLGTLVQPWMELEQSLDLAARHDDQHGIEGDAYRESAPLAGHQCALTEHLARTLPGEELGAVEQVDGPGHHEVERVGLISRAIDGLVFPECNLAEEAEGLGALRRAEEAEGRKREEGLP